MNIIDATADRVLHHSSETVTEENRQMMRARLLSMVDELDAIERRLRELEREWDMERTLEANAALISLAGVALGVRWKEFRILPAVVGGFLLQHAVQGWCPPVPLFRHLGVRTMKEIDQERYALKALRGDFAQILKEQSRQAKADAAMEAVGLEEKAANPEPTPAPQAQG